MFEGLMNITSDELLKLSDKISAKIKDNSGNAKRSFMVVTSPQNYSVELRGVQYLYWLNYGSRPWSRPENYKKLGYILDTSLSNNWAKNRGVNAYAAAHEIAYHGNYVYQNPDKGIQLEQLTKEMLNELGNKIPEEMSKEIDDILINKFPEFEYKAKY
jgi:hypothetical protein